MVTKIPRLFHLFALTWRIQQLVSAFVDNFFLGMSATSVVEQGGMHNLVLVLVHRLYGRYDLYSELLFLLPPGVSGLVMIQGQNPHQTPPQP
jgi:hypothetical protein